MKRVGYFRVSRDEMEVLGNDGALVLVWTRLLDWAAYGRHRRPWGAGTIEVDVGQLPTTEEALAASYDLLTRKIVRRCLEQLERLRWIRREPLYGTGRWRGGTLVTIPSRASGRDSQRANGEGLEPLQPRALPPLPAEEGPAQGPAQGPELEEEPQQKKNKNNPPPLPPAPLPAEPRGGEGLEPEDPCSATRPPDPGLRAELQAILEVPILSPAAAASFDELWAETSGSREALLDEARWLAAQPQLERSSSISRVFHTAWLRQMVAKRQRNLEAWALEALRSGASADELAAGFRVPDGYNADRLRAFVREVARRLDPEALERGRL